VILDRDSGHGIKGRGFGSLLFKINTLGKFNMGRSRPMRGPITLNMGLIDKNLMLKGRFYLLGTQ
jgi:hypothetical protein